MTSPNRNRYKELWEKGMKDKDSDIRLTAYSFFNDKVFFA